MSETKPIDVSILMLTHNRLALSEKYIPGILDRIGRVSYEVLIWDNGSTDGTYDWLAQFGQADCRVTKVFGHEKNIGMEAFNFLAEEARGKYLLKVDDDIEVPNKFVQRLMAAYIEVNEPKLAFLGWDMSWNRGSTTFATRSGMSLYKEPHGKIVGTAAGRVLISFDPNKWMVNGCCRFGSRSVFLGLGGHPAHILYGVDYLVSRAASKAGYWVGFLNTSDLVLHCGDRDTTEYRQMKNRELKRAGSPLDV